jgi:hypothetical protein
MAGGFICVYDAEMLTFLSVKMVRRLPFYRFGGHCWQQTELASSSK